MIVSLIVAVSENGVIGRDGRVPWHLPADLKLFKQNTMGHHLVVGRRTYQSIGRPLPGRTMLVLSRQLDYKVPGCQVVPSLEQALEVARIAGDPEVFIAGGAVLYAQALPLVQRMYLTRVHAEVAGDTFFPAYDHSMWRERYRQFFPAGEDQEFSFTFMLLERIPPQGLSTSADSRLALKE